MSYKLSKLFFFIGSECNLSCKHCYITNNKPLKKSNQEHLYSKLVRFMKDNKISELRITGGEPTIYKEIIHLINDANRNNIAVTFYTNGVLLDDDWLSAIRQNRKNKIVFSLYGTNSERHNYITNKDSFNITINNIKKSISYKIIVNVTVPISLPIIEDIDGLFKMCENFKISSLKFIKLSPPFSDTFGTKKIMPTNNDYISFCEFIDKSSNNYSFTIRLPKEFSPCLINTNSPLLSITEDGSVYACCIHVYNSNYLIGNILFDDSKKIFYNLYSNLKPAKNNEKKCLLQFT